MKTLNASQNQEERKSKKDGFQKKDDPPKPQMTDAEGHSDPDIGARLSYKNDPKDVTSSVLLLDSLYQAKEAWLTVTFNAKAIPEEGDGDIPYGDGLGTWYYRIVTSSAIDISQHVYPLPIHFGPDSPSTLFPKPDLYTFSTHQIKPKAGAELNAKLTIQLLRREKDLQGPTLYPERREHYIEKKIGTLTIKFGSQNEVFYLMKEVNLVLSIGTVVKGNEPLPSMM